MEVSYWPGFTTEGTLEELPLPTLIACILDERLTGNLHIESGDEKCWIHFDEGFPSGVHAPKSQDFLGSILREMGVIDDAAFNESLMAMAKTKRLQGEVLLEMGKIDPEQLERALSLQLARKLARLFTLKEGSFQFVEFEEVPPPVEPIRINPYALIYNGIKNAYGADDLKKSLTLLVGKACKASRVYVERKDLFEFPDEDLADAELLRDFRLPQEYVRHAKGGATSAMMMLMALLCCGMLELEEPDFAVPIRGGAGARPSRPTPQPAAGAPGGAPDGRQVRRAVTPVKVSPELAKKIHDKYEQIKDADLWGVLEVERGANMESCKKSYLVLAKVYHPDRIASAKDAELAHRISVIASQLNEAYEVLADPMKAAEYEKGGGSAKAKSAEARQEDAEFQFQKTKVYIKKNDLAKAAESIRWAVEQEPEKGDYQAYRVWVAFLQGEGGNTEQERIMKAKADLLVIAKRDRNSFHAAKFLYKLYKKLDDVENLGRALALAHKLDRNDVETTRELRLFNLRKEKEEKSKRFLGIKFKK